MAPESTKTTLQIPHERAGRAVVSQKLGGRLISAVALGGGWSGAGVYRVRAALGGERGQEQEVIVKVGPVHGSPVADEHAPTRSYARSRNLRPVHTLLRAHGLPTYELLACEFPSAEVPYFWVAMSALEGRPLDEWLGRTTGRDLAALHHLAGEALGRVHAITRPYDGWVDQPIPSRVDWGAACFRGLETSLDGALERARAYEERRGRPVRPGDGSLAGGDALLRASVAAHRLRWVPPREYVLSHIDGIQAVVDRDPDGTGDTGDTGDTRGGTRWVLSGHVDLEDFAFIDARMALAGYQLEYEGPVRRRRVPPEFWAGYRHHKEVDPTYEATRTAFHLAGLLVFSRAAYSAQWERWYRDPTEQERDADHYARAFVGLAAQP